MRPGAPFCPEPPSPRQAAARIVEADLNQSAVAALRTAAERVGVDPYRLACFLGQGRLADLLEALGRPNSNAPTKILGLAEAYLEFLESEIAIQEGRRPSGAGIRSP